MNGYGSAAPVMPGTQLPQVAPQSSLAAALMHGGSIPMSGASMPQIPLGTMLQLMQQQNPNGTPGIGQRLWGDLGSIFGFYGGPSASALGGGTGADSTTPLTPGSPEMLQNQLQLASSQYVP